MGATNADARAGDPGAQKVVSSGKNSTIDNREEHRLQAQIEAFRDRCRTLAARVVAGQLSFIDGVDMAHSAALWSGLVDVAGDDAIQSVLAATFGSLPREAAR